MAMELKVTTPAAQPIVWNYEEIKAAVAEKVQDYTNLVYTDKQIKEAKADRAALRKFQSALDGKRKEIKSACLDPYTAFEKELKEVTALVDEPIRMIDKQVKEFEEKERIDKQEKIREIWQKVADEGLSYSFITLEDVQQPEWLNKSFSLSKIEEAIRADHFRRSDDVFTLSKLGDNSAVAMQDYKKHKDLNHAIKAMQEFEEQQAAKAAYEAKRQEAERIASEAAQVDRIVHEATEQKNVQTEQRAAQNSSQRRMKVTLEVIANDLQLLNQLLAELKQNSESTKVILEVIANESQFKLLNQILLEEQRRSKSMKPLAKEEL